MEFLMESGSVKGVVARWAKIPLEAQAGVIVLIRVDSDMVTIGIEGCCER
jgi:hypothetical protein